MDQKHLPANDEMFGADDHVGVEYELGEAPYRGNSYLADQLRASGDAPSIAGDLAWASERLGHDFSTVQVRTAADGVGARPDALAWTQGTEVNLPTSYRPGTCEGRELLVHELAHVLQQEGSPKRPSLSAIHPNEVARYTIAARQVLIEAMEAIDGGIVEAFEDSAPVNAGTARGQLEAALRVLDAVDTPETSPQAAKVAMVFLEAARSPDAANARTVSDNLNDSDTGTADPLEREAQSAAASAVSGEQPITVARDPTAPATQRLVLVDDTLILLGMAIVVATAGLITWINVRRNTNTGVTFPDLTWPETQTQNKTQDKIREKAEPIAIPLEDARRNRDWGAMQFQVQWGAKGAKDTSPGQGVFAASPFGVTSAEATLGILAAQGKASAIEASAAIAAEPAVQEAIEFVQSAPLKGGVSGNFSQPFYFKYDPFKNARVDVVNLKGHNLRQ